MLLYKSESGTMEFNHDLVHSISSENHNATKSILQKYQYLYKHDDSSGRTLLHVSAEYGNSEITRYLIQCGCKVNAQDKLGMTPLMLAITYAQDGATVEVLLEANADIHLTDTQKSSSLRKVIEASKTWFANLNTEPLQKTKYYVLRAIFSKLENEFVVDRELIVNKLREVHCPFALVVFMNNVAVTEYVLGAGFFLDERVGSLSALHIAVALSDLDNLKFLVGHGADVNARDNRQQTPLFFYDIREDCNAKQLDILESLVDYGASLMLPRSDGVTLMEYFFAHGHENTLKTLVQTETDELKKLTPDGRTPLHFLARNKNGVHAVMKLLANKSNIDIDARDVQGKTALVEAVRNFDVFNVEFLISAGAKVNLIDIFDSTVLFDRLRFYSEDLPRWAHIMYLLVHRGNCCYGMRFRPEIASSVQNPRNKKFALPKLMLKHLTLDEASGKNVNKYTLKEIRFVRLLSDYYDLCKLQLQDMTKTIVYETVTLYKLISMSEEQIMLYARNQDFIEAFEKFMRGKSCKEFYYFDFLRKRVDSASERDTLRRKACRVIFKIFQLYGIRRYPDDVLFYEIAMYLSDKDLHNLLSV